VIILSKNKALYGLIAATIVMTGFSLALADVIFTYTGYASVSVQGAPIAFSLGPNNLYSPWISTATGPTGFSVNVAVTNAAEIYYDEPIELTVNQAGNIYVNNITISGSLINNMYVNIVTGPQSSPSLVGSLPIIQDGKYAARASFPSTSPSLVSLSTGTYYLSLWIEPYVPLSSSSGTETVTVSFGYNVVANSAVPVVTLATP